MAGKQNLCVLEEPELFSLRPPYVTERAPAEFSFLHPLKPTPVFTTYWRFAVERQEIYFRRLRGEPGPWTDDPVLRTGKFTNAYRAADRVSQYLIRHVIGETPWVAEDLFFRILLFKLFNRIDTWELLVSAFGEPRAADFDAEGYAEVLDGAFSRGRRLYSAAYIMPSGGGRGFARKHRMHLHLLEEMLRAELPERIAEAGTMGRAFALLRAVPTFGDFLAYQFITDLNYSPLTSFKESEFVVPGPGARSGLRKCFSSLGGLSEAEVIRVVADHQEECLRALELRFPTLWGRRLQLIDCQNLFCEVDKYARVAHPELSVSSGRTRIKQKLRPSAFSEKPLFPARWGLNERIQHPPAYVPDS